MKMGIPRILLVTILSTLSERLPLSSLSAFLTVLETVSDIMSYLLSVMIESAESSFFSSSSSMTAFRDSLAPGRASSTALSPSSSLNA